jgi:putative tricarboxylic transport membrane protein
MLSDIASGLLSVAAPGPVLGVAFGILVGIIFGAMPGISGIMAIALLLPVTFYLDPIIGIPMLLGIYKAGIFGGSISAVLLNTPGAPPAVCTAMEGYPLTCKGKAGKALHIALTASVFGDTFSNLVLFFTAAPLAAIALDVGPAEQFCLIVLAFTVVGTISGPSLTKGIICAGLGILISTIGFSETTGAARFTFGSGYLAAGVSLIPMVIGLLCLPEIIHQVGLGAKERMRYALTLSKNPDDNHMTLKEFKQCLPIMVRSSIIGSVLGALPGIGASPAAFMAYSEARRISKKPEEFNHGALEGLAAPEAANNATTGAAMVPMLTLGIPGDDVTAVLLGAFIIQGITPGPTIFQEHGQLIYGIYGGLLLCDLLLYYIAKFGFPAWIRLSQLPKSVIFPAVTVFCFVGAYSINQNMFDVLCLICFGVVGYFIRKYEYSAGAVIIGFILGPLWERSFDQALTLSGGSLMIFIERPIAGLLLACSLLSGIGIAVSRIRLKKRMEMLKSGLE